MIACSIAPTRVRRQQIAQARDPLGIERGGQVGVLEEPAADGVVELEVHPHEVEPGHHGAPWSMTLGAAGGPMISSTPGPEGI